MLYNERLIGAIAVGKQRGINRVVKVVLVAAYHPTIELDLFFSRFVGLVHDPYIYINIEVEITMLDTDKKGVKCYT